MIEPGIAQGMVEYVTHAVLDVHRDMHAYRQQQQHGVWKALPVRSAMNCSVGVMGLGTLGTAVVQHLTLLKFNCAAWSRTKHLVDGVATYAGFEQLGEFLRRTQVLVCLVPLTDTTRGILNAKLFGRLPSARHWSTLDAERILLRPTSLLRSTPDISRRLSSMSQIPSHSLDTPVLEASSNPITSHR